ncbi:DUF7146 domain-containing protein [Laribacter hongkongensis]|uniref:Toprim domain-containing protein n=1 Tax=Laribacter hongkongensis TaxID=168471 RepID=A0ABD4SWD5_9NEIS|nr:toprim domain-containing protein [Laribacter hongkongensis]MCG9026939.1 toprim domain-containing protein [Laribacter hongkongensis]MCG9100295.1 toprim domain-containing protein [Laribacter hongkongensis]MCG9119655.1 toprim domain-containing protein [Laribacter hongkongensis]
MTTNHPHDGARGGLRLESATVMAAARHQWPGILTRLGISDRYLKRQHGPCPGCGGRDRFRFDDREGRGTWLCSGGGADPLAGDGLALVRHVFDCGFAEALRLVAGTLGMTGTSPCPPQATRPVAPSRPPISRLPSILRQWDEALPLTGTCPTSRYLAGRGLALERWPDDLRCHPALPYWADRDGKPFALCRLPALLALVRDKAGEIVGLHRTYLADRAGQVGKARLVHPDTGECLPAKKLVSVMPGATTGAAIRLAAPDNGRLGLAEGIETALACWQASGIPTWAGISAHGMESVRLPDDVPGIWIFADHDASGTGQKVAHRLAARLHDEGRQVRVLLPSRPGTDWADVLNEGVEA